MDYKIAKLFGPNYIVWIDDINAPVFGPATFAECEAYVAEHSAP